MLRFMRNDTAKHYNWVSVRLIGNGTTSNRDAIGARVEVVVRQEPGGPRNVRELRAGEGFLSQSSKTMHFGLGEARYIDHVVVHWPGGQKEVVAGIEINRRYQIRQGSTAAESISSEPRVPKLRASSPEPIAAPPNTRVVLQAAPHVVPLKFQNSLGQLRDIPLGQDEHILINLWATWCRPCLKELSDFTEHAGRLRKAGITIYALNMDPYGRQKSEHDAEAVLSGLQFPFPHGHPTAATVEILEAIRMVLLPVSGELAIPTSYLINPARQLTAVYRGIVDIDALIADAGGESHDGLLPGRSIADPRLSEADRMRAMRVYSGIAQRMTQRQMVDEAVLYYQELQKISPPRADTHVVLGRLYQDHKRQQAAIQQFTKALKIAPADEEALFLRGIAYSHVQNLNHAIADFQQLIRINPGHASAHSNLGSSYARMEMWKEAEAAYARALEIEPKHEHALENLKKLNALRAQ